LLDVTNFIRPWHVKLLCQDSFNSLIVSTKCSLSIDIWWHFKILQVKIW
jgi:hypothetical protein